jgi:hypothetical protein
VRAHRWVDAPPSSCLKVVSFRVRQAQIYVIDDDPWSAAAHH